MAFRSSSEIPSEGVATNCLVPVPSGAAVDDIAVVHIYTELQNTSTITPPSGFTQKVDVATNGTSQGRLTIFWKRLTAADTGTYDFTFASCWRTGSCCLFSGRVATGDPFNVTTTADAGATLRGVTLGTITASANSDIVASASFYQGVGVGPTMTSMTVRTGGSAKDQSMATQDNFTGATGSRIYQYTGGSAGGCKGFIGALTPAGAASVRRPLTGPQAYAAVRRAANY